MIAKLPPKTVKELINSMIRPEGIKKGENIAGTELLDGEEWRMMHLRRKMIKITLTMNNCWQHKVETLPSKPRPKN